LCWWIAAGECYAAVGSVRVVVLDIGVEHSLEMAPSADEGPIETFSADRADDARSASAPLFSRLMSVNFSTQVTQTGEATVISVRGEIDLATCDRLRNAIEPHMGPEQTIVLDLSEVEFMDSSCLRMLIEARTTLTADRGSLILRNPSEAAHRLLSAAGATDLLDTDARDHDTSS